MRFWKLAVGAAVIAGALVPLPASATTTTAAAATTTTPPKQVALQRIAALRNGVQSYRAARAIRAATVSSLLLKDLQAAQTAVGNGSVAPQVFAKFASDVESQRGGAIFAGSADVLVGVADGTVPTSVVKVSPTAASTVTRPAGSDRVAVGIPAASSLGSVQIGPAASAKPISVPSGRQALGAVQVQAYAPTGTATLTIPHPLQVAVTFGPVASNSGVRAAIPVSGTSAPAAELDTVDPVTKSYERLPTTVTSNADGTYTATATTANAAPFLLSAPSASGVVSTYAGSGGEGPANAVAQDEDGLLIHGNTLYVADPLGQVRAIDLTTGYEVVVAGAPGAGSATTNGDGGPATDAQLQYPTSVAMDASGNLYIAEMDKGAIRKVDTTGTISTFATFAIPIGEKYGWVGSLAMSPTGNLYATTSQGLASIDPTGAVTLYPNTPAGTLAIDATGQLYTAWNDDSNIQNPLTFIGAVSPTGTVTTLYQQSGLGGFSLTPDNEGHLLVADFSNNIVRSFDLGTDSMTTIAGNGVAGYVGRGTLATSAELWGPNDVAIDGNGAIYIADSQNQVIRRVDYSGIITTFAGNGSALYSGDGGPATAAEFQGPRDPVVDSAGDVFLLDYGNHAVRKIDPSGVITTFANGVGNPVAAALDSSGNLYVADYGSACSSSLIEISPAGAQTTLVSGQCGIDGVAVDASGDVYYPMFTYPAGVDFVKELRTDGTTVTVAGGGTGGDGGLAIDAHLQQPGELALDPAGNLYIADDNTNVVRKVDTNGIITTVAGNGTAGYSGDNGPAAKAQLDAPGQLAFDSAGDLLIADTFNNVVREVTPGGQISTIVGTGIRGLTEDGAAPTATAFDTVDGVTLDSAGDLFVTDSGTVREIRSYG